MYGVKNCAASQEYYNSIVNMYASWDVDFIKCDDICVTEFRQWDNPYSADYEIEMLRSGVFDPEMKERILADNDVH